jgi:eukaryotic-like serine/threonine-protein kinase
VPVCQAVQHAHQKGIIHRDIKPTNVLVTLHDGTPLVKIIDFGIAKALGQQLTDKTLFTGFAQMIGTPLYMSPEQTALSNADVDTRSDIYSLGVLLYELLTGTTPFDKERLKEAGYDEIRRIVREEEPPKPSTRISTLGQAATTLSAQRRSDPKRLSQLCRGELDWIVMKALEKDRNRRYESASAFAADVQRYLHDEPVQACPPSAWYRCRKFARRNKGPVLAASLLVLALVVGMLGTTWGLVHADKARQDAVNAQQAEELRAEGERQAKDEAQAVLAFVENRVFAAARPQGIDGGLGADVTLRKAVESAVQFVEKSFPNQPLIEARLRLTLGTSFSHLGDARTAAEQFETARLLFARHLGADHPSTLWAMNDLAASYQELSRFDDALKLHEQTLALRRSKLGPDDPGTFGSIVNIALCYYELGRYTDALQRYEAALALMRVKIPDEPFTFSGMAGLASCYFALDRHDDALKLREETLALRKAKLEPDHPDTLASMAHLADSYHALGRHDDALKLRQETLELRTAKLRPDHPHTLQSMNALADSYFALGQYAGALKLREQTLALQKAKLPPNHPDTLASMGNLVISYHAAGRYADALKLAKQTLALKRAKLGIDHPSTLTSMQNLTICYTAAGQHTDALKLRKETLALAQAKFGRTHRVTLQNMGNLANSYDYLGQHAEAIKLQEQALQLMKDNIGSDDPLTLNGMHNLAEDYASVDRHADALKLHEQTLALRKVKLGPDHPETLRSMGRVADSLVKLGRGVEAVPVIDECVQRGAGKVLNPRLLPGVMNLRLRHFEKIMDAAGCRQTAERWEKLKRADPVSLYDAACMRAVTAGVIRKNSQTPGADATGLAKEEADRAMAWLKQAVAAGFKDAAHMKQDTDLDALRGREDFWKLEAQKK